MIRHQINKHFIYKWLNEDLFGEFSFRKSMTHEFTFSILKRVWLVATPLKAKNFFKRKRLIKRIPFETRLRFFTIMNIFNISRSKTTTSKLIKSRSALFLPVLKHRRLHKKNLKYKNLPYPQIMLRKKRIRASSKRYGIHLINFKKYAFFGMWHRGLGPIYFVDTRRQILLGLIPERRTPRVFVHRRPRFEIKTYFRNLIKPAYAKNKVRVKRQQSERIRKAHTLRYFNIITHPAEYLNLDLVSLIGKSSGNFVTVCELRLSTALIRSSFLENGYVVSNMIKRSFFLVNGLPVKFGDTALDRWDCVTISKPVWWFVYARFNALSCATRILNRANVWKLRRRGEKKVLYRPLLRRFFKKLLGSVAFELSKVPLRNRKQRVNKKSLQLTAASTKRRETRKKNRTERAIFKKWVLQQKVWAVLKKRSARLVRRVLILKPALYKMPDSYKVPLTVNRNRVRQTRFVKPLYRRLLRRNRRQGWGYPRKFGKVFRKQPFIKNNHNAPGQHRWPRNSSAAGRNNQHPNTQKHFGGHNSNKQHVRKNTYHTQSISAEYRGSNRYIAKNKHNAPGQRQYRWNKTINTEDQRENYRYNNKRFNSIRYNRPWGKPWGSKRWGKRKRYFRRRLPITVRWAKVLKETDKRAARHKLAVLNTLSARYKRKQKLRDVVSRFTKMYKKLLRIAHKKGLGKKLQKKKKCKDVLKNRKSYAIIWGKNLRKNSRRKLLKRYKSSTFTRRKKLRISKKNLLVTRKKLNKKPSKYLRTFLCHKYALSRLLDFYKLVPVSRKYYRKRYRMRKANIKRLILADKSANKYHIIAPAPSYMEVSYKIFSFIIYRLPTKTTDSNLPTSLRSVGKYMRSASANFKKLTLPGNN